MLIYLNYGGDYVDRAAYTTGAITKAKYDATADTITFTTGKVPTGYGSALSSNASCLTSGNPTYTGTGFFPAGSAARLPATSRSTPPATGTTSTRVPPAVCARASSTATPTGKASPTTKLLRRSPPRASTIWSGPASATTCRSPLRNRQHQQGVPTQGRPAAFSPKSRKPDSL
jgi:hypothetical protein